MSEDAIRERLNAATPGPWKVSGSDSYDAQFRHPNHDAWPYIDAADGTSVHGYLGRMENGWPNADLIANAPTDIAFLLAEVSSVRSRLGEAESQRDRLGQALGELLVAMKFTTNTAMTGPQLLVAAEDAATDIAQFLERPEVAAFLSDSLTDGSQP